MAVSQSESLIKQFQRSSAEDGAYWGLGFRAAEEVVAVPDRESSAIVAEHVVDVVLPSLVTLEGQAAGV